MRWSKALQVAPHPEQADEPITITHQSGSYQDIYKTHVYLYLAGSGTGYRTARSSVVHHVLNEFDLNDNGWYPLSGSHKRHLPWFARLSRILSFFTRRKTQAQQGAEEEAAR